MKYNYEENQNLINKIIWNIVISRNHRITYEELLGSAFIGFVKASESYQQTKGKFSTYLHAYLSFYLSREIEKDINKNIARIDESVPEPPKPNDTIYCNENLSQDAHLAIGLAVSLDVKSKREVSEKLRAQGWKLERIRRTFRELRNCFVK